jgi:hypothetical protein
VIAIWALPRTGPPGRNRSTVLNGSGVVNGVYIVKSGDTLSEIMSEQLGDTGFNEQVLAAGDRQYQQERVSTRQPALVDGGCLPANADRSRCDGLCSAGPSATESGW